MGEQEQHLLPCHEQLAQRFVQAEPQCLRAQSQEPQAGLGRAGGAAEALLSREQQLPALQREGTRSSELPSAKGAWPGCQPAPAVTGSSPGTPDLQLQEVFVGLSPAAH